MLIPNTFADCSPSVGRPSGPAVTTPADHRRVHDLLAQAALHYRRSLAGAPGALAYLKARGVGYVMAQRFELGYACSAWRDLGEVLGGYGKDEIAASGLVVPHPGGRRAGGFDRFRDRLMFPIRDLGGQVAGFGARAVGDRGPGMVKYINSPEGPCFRKRELLYGLHEAQHAIRQHGFAVVMEGYLDVLLSVQAGLEVAVGSLGTALSVHQVQSLLALAPRLVFCFDADEAGRLAARRALHLAAPFASGGRRFAFAMLPPGQDPASLLQSEGPAALWRSVRQAVAFDVFAAQCAGDGCDLTIAEGRARCAAQLGQVWRLMPPSPARDMLVWRCAVLLSQSEAVVRQMWLRLRSAQG